MIELLTEKYKNLEDFIDWIKGYSNTTILEMEDEIIASVQKKGWDIDIVKKFLEALKESTETAKKLQQQAEEKERARQAKEEATKILEELKDVDNVDKIKESLTTIGEIPSLITPIELIKAYSREDNRNDERNDNPDKYFCPKLFNALPFPDGTSSVIGARTSRGKTTALINLAAEAMENERKVLFITLEMSGLQLYRKLILQRVYAKADKNIRNTILDNINEVENPTKNLAKIFKADDNSVLTGFNEYFLESVRKEKEFVLNKTDKKELQLFQHWQLDHTTILTLISQQEKGTLVLLDYIQRMPITSAEKRDERYIQIKKISDALTNATKKSGGVTIYGAQFNRVAGKNDDGDDAFSDISFREGGGDIEQDVDNAIGIGWKKDKKTRFCEILKARESEYIGKKYPLEFNGAYSYMDNTGQEFVPKEKNTNGQQPAKKGDYNATCRKAVAGSNPRIVG